MAELARLGRYQITRVLGRGAMGVVYEGLDPRLNRRVAIKTILKNAAIDDETAQHYSAQFQREAQAAGRLNHPNIVHVHDFAEEGDVAYLVMEYIQGRELRSYFDAKEAFEAAEAVRIMGELLDALHYAHEAGIIHRDVKPANVMLDAEKRVKLADFGVARIQDSERSAAGTMVGTPAFMSPEQIQGQKIDRRTDVFSAGVVLYQLLTGEQPFTGAGAWTVAKKIMQDDPPRPSSVVRSISPAFDAIVDRALAKKPADRYASAREFATDLRAALGGAQPPASASLPPAAAPRPRGAQASEAEVEFWKAIQNSTDAAEFEFYLEQFPEGTYAALARHKISRLGAQAAPAAEAAERQRKEAEDQAKREAEEKARREAEAQAKREAEARAKRVAEELAQRQAAEKAQREAAEKARQEAAERARREAEAKAQRQAAALAKLRREEEARKAAAADPEATVAIARPEARAAAVEPAVPAKKSFLVPALIGALVIAAAAVAFVVLSRKPAPEPVAQAPKPEVTAAEIEKIRKETEERVRKEYADKSAAEQAAAAKAAADKAVQEKQAAAERAAAEKAAAEKALAAKAAAEKAATEKAASAKVAADKAAAEKAAADKLAAEKAAAEKAAAERAAAEKAASDKLAAEKAATAKAAAARKPGWPAVGDRWVYEAKDSQRPENHYTFTVEAKAVGPGSISDTTTRPNGSVVDVTHGPGVRLVGVAQGIVNVNPYLYLFQDLGAGKSWSAVEFRQLFKCAAGFDCRVSGSVAGRERVHVKAGSFDAVKVVFTVYSTNGNGGTAVIELRYWFAQAANRVIKYELRTTAPMFSQPLMDYELASYTPAAS